MFLFFGFIGIKIIFRTLGLFDSWEDTILPLLLTSIRLPRKLPLLPNLLPKKPRCTLFTARWSLLLSPNSRTRKDQAVWRSSNTSNRIAAWEIIWTSRCCEISSGWARKMKLLTPRQVCSEHQDRSSCRLRVEQIPKKLPRKAPRRPRRKILRPWKQRARPRKQLPQDDKNIAKEIYREEGFGEVSRNMQLLPRETSGNSWWTLQLCCFILFRNLYLFCFENHYF